MSCLQELGQTSEFLLWPNRCFPQLHQRWDGDHQRGGVSWKQTEGDVAWVMGSKMVEQKKPRRQVSDGFGLFFLVPIRLF